MNYRYYQNTMKYEKFQKDNESLIKKIEKGDFTKEELNYYSCIYTSEISSNY